MLDKMTAVVKTRAVSSLSTSTTMPTSTLSGGSKRMRTASAEESVPCKPKLILPLVASQTVTRATTSTTTNTSTTQTQQRDDELNRSLTNLQWLLSANFITKPPESTVSSPRVKRQSVQQQQQRQSLPVHHEESSCSEDDEIDPAYLHSDQKPPYSYAVLIYMAIKHSKKDKVSLKDIYKYITDRFAYYSNVDSTWKNSIRHNLSQSKCFAKAGKPNSKTGKGGLWMLNPDHIDELEELINTRKKKQRKSRASSSSINSATSQQCRNRTLSIASTEPDTPMYDEPVLDIDFDNPFQFMDDPTFVSSDDACSEHQEDDMASSPCWDDQFNSDPLSPTTPLPWAAATDVSPAFRVGVFSPMSLNGSFSDVLNVSATDFKASQQRLSEALVQHCLEEVDFQADAPIPSDWFIKA